MNFEVFCPHLEKALAYSDGDRGGRPRSIRSNVQDPGDPDAEHAV